MKLSARAPLKKTSLIGFLQIINEAVGKSAIFIPTLFVLPRKLSRYVIQVSGAKSHREVLQLIFTYMQRLCFLKVIRSQLYLRVRFGSKVQLTAVSSLRYQGQSV